MMKPIVRRGIYVVPSLITLGNLSAGIVSILLSSQGHLTSAAWAIIAGMIMDIMDGRVARWTGCTSQFGVELDSLCDLITFGVAPGILMYWLALEPLGRAGYAIAIFFAICAAALRLARFNLRAQSGEVSTHFVGLPVPAAAGILASFVLSYELFDNQEMTVKTIPLLMKRMPMFFHLVPLVVLALSLLMISTIRYNNFKKLKLFRPRSLQTLGVVVVGLLLIFTYPQNVIFIVFSLYVLSGLTSLAVRVLQRAAGEHAWENSGGAARIDSSITAAMESHGLKMHGPLWRNKMKNERVIIFDTTLRDGEQAPGCSLGTEQKLQVADQLYRLGVDVIEAGFPVSSRGDFDAVSQIAKTIGRRPEAPEICGLARCVEGDIKACGEAVRGAKRPRVHVFIATSDIHLKHKLHMTRG